MAPPHNARAAGVDKRPALFHNIFAGGIEMVFMSLMNLRPRAIRPIDRRPLPFRAERRRRVA
jgi:hypothetical protein